MSDAIEAGEIRVNLVPDTAGFIKRFKAELAEHEDELNAEMERLAVEMVAEIRRQLKLVE